MDEQSKAALPKPFCSQTPFGYKKITTNPHILAQVDTKCPDSRYPKLKICISEITSDTHKYISLTYITMHCMI